MFKSRVAQVNTVEFPAFMAEKVYQQKFFKGQKFEGSLSRWQDTVDTMIDHVDSDGPMFLMIDAAAVQAGKTHRRGGVHIDGHWVEQLQAHNNPRPGGHMMMAWEGPRPWGNPSIEVRPEDIILASNVTGSAGYLGDYSPDVVREGGDCSALDLSTFEKIEMEANKVYCGNVTFLHESAPVTANALRQVVRIVTPGWTMH